MEKKVLLLCDKGNIHEARVLCDEFPGVNIRPFHFDNDETLPEYCVIVALSYQNIYGGPKKSQADFFRRNRNVKRWIIAITNIEGTYGPTLSKWKQLSIELEAPAEIIASRSFSGAVEKFRDALNKNVNKCIIGYMRNESIAKSFTNLLNQTIAGWEFEAVQEEQLENTFKTAGKLILFGQQPRDFKFKGINIDANKDLTLVYHCPGYLYKHYYTRQCLISIAVLRQEGWELSDAFSAYLPCNTKYEQAKISEHPSDGGENILWDAYGLPHRGEEMPGAETALFWNQFLVSKQIDHWLNK